MISISLEYFATFFLVAALASFFAVTVYYDRKDRTYYDTQRRQHVHHCIKCGTLYTAKDFEGMVSCPKCGFKNSVLRF